MPQELPGFYFDPKKNRYFPIKGPIPGSTPRYHHIQMPEPTQEQGRFRRAIRTAKLLEFRELHGNIITFNNQKGSFQEECKKNLASESMVWKYTGTERESDGALAQMHIDVETPEGQRGTDVLFSAGLNSSLRLFEVGKLEHFNHGVNLVNLTSECVWPKSNQPGCRGPLKDVWRLNGVSLELSSSISCISTTRKESFRMDNRAPAVRRAFITTLGSESAAGSIYIWDVSDPVDLSSSISPIGRLRELASLNCTIWSADCNSIGNRVVIGTNLGGTLLNVETGVPSVLCHSKSDVLSVQLIQAALENHWALKDASKQSLASEKIYTSTGRKFYPRNQE